MLGLAPIAAVPVSGRRVSPATSPPPPAPAPPGGFLRRDAPARLFARPSPARLFARAGASRLLWRRWTVDWRPTYPLKAPAEDREFLADYSTFPEVAGGDLPVSAVVQLPGGGPLAGISSPGTPTLLTADATDPSGRTARADRAFAYRLAGGAHGTDYPVEVLATLQSGRTVSVQEVVRVRNVTA